MKVKVALILSSIYSLAGCTNINDYDVQQHAAKNKEKIEEIKNRISLTPDVVLFDIPFVKAVSKEKAALPEWTFINYQGTITGTLDEIVNTALRPRFLNIDYVGQVNEERNKTDYTVSVGKGGTLLDMIKAIGTATGYAYVIDGNKVSFQKYLTKTFPIKHIAGDTIITLNENSELATATTTNNHTASYNVLKSIEREVRDFLRLEDRDAQTAENPTVPINPDGTQMDVNLSELKRNSMQPVIALVDEGTSILTVKATPAEMKEIEKLIAEKNEYLSRQVFVEMEVLNVEFNDSNQTSVDFDLLKAFDSDNLVAGVTSSAATSIISTAFGAGSFSATKSDGLNNSTLLIQALEEQGTVTSEVLPAARVANNKRAIVKQTENIFYISDRDVGSTSTAVTGGVTQTELEVGFSMEVMPVIVGQEISLKIKTIVNSLTDIETKGEGNQAVESPRTREAIYSTDIILKNGESAVFTQLSKAESSSKFIKSGWGIFGFGDKVSQDNSERLLMIKATIL